MTDMHGTAAHAAQAGPSAPAEDLLFAGPGELRSLCRTCDWSDTPLGPVEGWPQHLRTTVDLCLASPFPMCVWWGPELVLIYNDRYLEVLGVARHPWALGHPAAEVWAEVWDQVAHEFARVMDGGTVSHVDQRYVIRRDGHDVEAFFTYALSPVRDDTGAAAGVLNVVTETTDRVRLVGALGAERERLRSLIRDMPAPVALHIGPEHRFEIVSESFQRIASGRNLLGSTPAEAYPELAGQGILEHFDEVFETGEAWVAHERHARIDRRGTGIEDTWFDVRYEPVRDAAGTVIGVLNFSFDVTEQVRARQDVERLLVESEQSRRDADAANRSKSEFLAVMSHELRTPLNAIGGYAELIELGIHGPVSEAQHTALDRIQASQRHLLGLIAGVLDYSRVEAGAVTYRFADVPVAEAVAEAETLVAPQLRAKGIGYSWAGAPPDRLVRADREKLQQILLNLLGNAVKFTNAREDVPGRIDVSCAVEPHRADGSGARVAIQVRDTGEGIAPGELERVFEPFVQADQRLTRPHAGVGLGLAISRDLARGMGGDLTAESTLGVGSAFTLTLLRA